MGHVKALLEEKTCARCSGILREGGAMISREGHVGDARSDIPIEARKNKTSVGEMLRRTPVCGMDVNETKPQHKTYMKMWEPANNVSNHGVSSGRYDEKNGGKGLWRWPSS